MFGLSDVGARVLSKKNRAAAGAARAPASTPPGDAGDTSPNILVGGRQREFPPILLRTFGYSRPTFVALRSLSLKPISFGYKTPPIRFSQAGGQSAHEARPPPNLELALTPLGESAEGARPPSTDRKRESVSQGLVASRRCL